MPGTVVGCHLLCLGSCLARGVVLQLFVQTYHRLLQQFDTSITNAYSTHFVKSSGLNANAKFQYPPHHSFESDLLQHLHAPGVKIDKLKRAVKRAVKHVIQALFKIREL
jgi:hypothetical protein